MSVQVKDIVTETAKLSSQRESKMPGSVKSAIFYAVKKE